jgi:exodeoxyribonuclease VII small subunit
MTTPDGRPNSSTLDPDLVRWRAALDAGVFEEAFRALEEVVDRLEQGQLRLEETLSCYELGVRLAERCGRILDEAELRVTRLDDALEHAAEHDFDDLVNDEDETG